MERTSEDELKAHLMQTSPEFRELAEQHCAYKRLVSDLEAKGFLSEQEEAEEQRLKKIKLQIKDQMNQMLFSFKAQHA